MVDLVFPGAGALRELRHDALHRLPSRFFEAAMEPALWREVLGETSSAFRAAGVTMIGLPDPRVGLLASEGVEECAHDYVKEEWWRVNRRPVLGIQKKIYGRSVTDHELFADDSRKRDQFEQDFMARHGLGSFLGSMIALPGKRVVTFSIDGRVIDDPYSASEAEAFHTLLPSIAQAARFSAHIGAARDKGAGDLLHALSCGVALLDIEGRVIAMNAAAERLLGTALRLDGKEIAARSSAYTAALRAMIAATLRGATPLVTPIAIERAQGRPVLAEAMPLPGAAGDLFRLAKAILFLVDPDATDAPAEAALRAAFGLTRAEARLAQSLTQGHELAEVAEAGGTTLGTARSQLKSIFAKTGTHRQGELVALMSRLSRPLGRR